jgi:hypothetical protein
VGGCRHYRRVMKTWVAAIAVAVAALGLTGSPAVASAAESTDSHRSEPAVVITSDSIAFGTVSDGAFVPGADLRLSVRSVSPRPGATRSWSDRLPASAAYCPAGQIPNDYTACVDLDQCVWPYEVLNGVCTLYCSTSGGQVIDGVCVPVDLPPPPPPPPEEIPPWNVGTNCLFVPCFSSLTATKSLRSRFPPLANCADGIEPEGRYPNDYGACEDVCAADVWLGVCTWACATSGGVVIDNGRTCVIVITGSQIQPPWPGPLPDQGADNLDCLTHPSSCVSKARPGRSWLGSPTLP